MKLTRNDMHYVITEAIKKVNEIHLGQQLMLPFDGSSEPYNYMQFIEFLENMGDYGVLPNPKIVDFTQDRNICLEAGEGRFFWGLSDELDEEGLYYFVEDFTEAYGNEVWADGEQPDIENMWPLEIKECLTPEGQNLWDNKLVNKGREVLEAFARMFTFNEKGQIYIERVIGLENLMDRYHVDSGYKMGGADYFAVLSHKYDGIGPYWTYAKGRGDTYFSGSRGSRITLKGWVNPEDVEWEQTIQLDGMDESEIRINGNVQIDEIVAEFSEGDKRLPLKGSLVIHT